MAFLRFSNDAVVKRLRWVMIGTILFDKLNTLLGQPKSYWQHPETANEINRSWHYSLSRGLPFYIADSVIEEHEIGMLVRVFVVYAAWLTMVFANISQTVWVLTVIAAPLFMGSVVSHLRKTHSLSVVNRLAFCGAVPFFPFLAVQIFAMSR